MLPDTITTSELMAMTGLSRPSLSRNKAKGIISPSGRDAWPTVETISALMAAYRDAAAAGGTSLDLAAERARLAREQADGHSMKNAQLRGELLPRAAVTAAVQAAFTRVRARMLAIPGKAAPLVMSMQSATEVQAALRDAVHEALAELSETEVVALEKESENG